MTNNEVNQYIHEKILGQCWHGPTEWKWVAELSGVRVCSKCKEGPVNPDYCSDDGPRRLLNEVVAKVVDIVGLDPYGRALTTIAFQNGAIDDHQHALFLMNTTAEQIARACAEAHKSNA